MNELRTSLKLTLAGLVASLLTTALLYSVLDGNEWFARSAGAVVLVTGVGALARLGRFPWLLIPFVQTALVGIYLTSTYASADAQSGWLPGKAALTTLRDMADAGFTEIDTVTPPLTPSQQVTLVVVAGVALMAILVDLLAAGMRQTALAGLPLLVLYVVPAAVLPNGIDGILFLLPACGYLLLLITDSHERLLRWGVAVSGRTGEADTRSSGELGQMTRRIGITVLSMSIVIPALAPRLSDGAFGSGGIGNDPDGGGTISTLNPLVSMRRDLVRPQDVDLLRVRTDSLNADELYLRAVTLDTFDGEEWRAGRREVGRFDGELPDPRGLDPDVAAQRIVTDVEVTRNLESDYVPMPFPATSLQIDGAWRVDPLTSNVVSRDGSKQIAGRRYSVTSLDLSPKAEDVTPALIVDSYLQPYLALPEDLPARVKELAQRVTKGQSTVLGRAIALQQWFRNPKEFAYDLRQRPGTGKDAILAFLSDRRGYCEQFASTMAVMARYLGIPSRVNVGFTPGSPDSDGSRIVSAHDAHAWPELWMPGVGWTRFEPTPGSAASDPDVPNWLTGKGADEPQGDQGDTQDGAPSPTPAAGQSGAPEPSAETPGQGTQNVTFTTDPPKDAEASGSTYTVAAVASSGLPVTFEVAEPADAPCTIAGAVVSFRGKGTCTIVATQVGNDVYAPASASQDVQVHDNSFPWALILTVLFFGGLPLLLLAAPALLRIAVRRRRWSLAAGPAGAGVEWAWVELRDSAVDLGYLWPDARTPRQASAELAADGKLGADGARALAVVTRSVERVRYAPGGGTGPGAPALRAAVDEVRRELGVTAGRRRRLRALLLPRSMGTMAGRLVLRIRAGAVAVRQSVLRALRPRRA